MTNTTITDKLLNAAIMAPSGHNTQPWLFKLQPDNSIIIMPDMSRRLPKLDPTDRELYISIGCATENMCIAATQYGLKAETKINGQSVEVTFKPQAITPSPLVQAIPERKCNRNIFDKTDIAADTLAELSQYGAKLFKSGSAEFDAIRIGIMLANKELMGDKSKKNELIEWMRYNRKETEIMSDGLGHDVLGIPDMPKWISRMTVSLALKARIQNAGDISKLMSSPYIAAFEADNDIAEWIECGRRLERFLLSATLHNVACAFICQPCEADSTAIELTTQLHLQHRLQILLRIGHAAPPAARSRRRPLSSFKIA